ncbi:MAG: hypothetical protein ABS939_00125 [Psychrobacillus sp.]
MFKIKGEALQQIVHGITKGAKKARLGESRVFISSTEEHTVKFYFVGEELQVEKTLECETTEQFAFATTMIELEIKVGALPDDELIHVVKEGDKVFLKWGRSSNIMMEIVPELSPEIEIPQATDTVTWGPGKLHGLARSLPYFAAIANSASANKYPVLRGLYFAKEETGEVKVRASNSGRAVTVNTKGMEWFDGVFCSIPTETVVGLIEILPSDSELRVSINAEETLIVFEAGHTKAVSRLLVGEFPPIDQAYITEESAKTIWRVDRLQLLETVRRIKRLGGNMPTMVFRVDGSKAFVELPGVLVEQIGASIDGDQHVGFILHSDYLELALTLHRTEEVLLCVKEENRPITILDDSETHDTKVLIAPLVN